MSEATAGLDTLLNAWENLGVRERKLVLVYMMRLWNGQRKYGKISLQKKQWRYEALEEALDACVYLSAALEDSSELAFEHAVEDAENEVRKEQEVKLTEFNRTYGELSQTNPLSPTPLRSAMPEDPVLAAWNEYAANKVVHYKLLEERQKAEKSGDIGLYAPGTK